jgi:hypothetical protein
VLLLSYFYQVEAGDGGAVYTGIAAAFEGCEFAANNASGNVSLPVLVSCCTPLAM